MTTELRQQLRRVATRMLTQHGEHAQLDQAQEEAAELIVAISHYQRCRDGSHDELMGELADMRIMLEQLMMIFDRHGSGECDAWLLKTLDAIEMSDATHIDGDPGGDA